MSIIKEAVDMPMYSRFGKSQASLTDLALLEKGRPKRDPPKNTKISSVISTQKDLEKTLAQVAAELAADSREEKSKKIQSSHSAVFLAVSREQRDWTAKLSDAPPPTHYTPNLKWVKPKTGRNIQLRPTTTLSRPRQVLLSSCVSEQTFTCKYAQKAADGAAIGKPGGKGLKQVPLSEYEKALTAREVETKDSYYPETSLRPPTFRISKQLPRKANPPSESSEERFNTLDFPTVYTGAKRVKTPNFEQSLGRREMFISDNLDEIYDYRFEYTRDRSNSGVPNFSKMSPRHLPPATTVPESPSLEKILKGLNKVLPRTHVPTLNMMTLTQRPDTAARVWDSVPKSAATTSRGWSLPGTAGSKKRPAA